MTELHPNSVTTPETAAACPGSLMLFETWLLVSLSPNICGTQELCSEPLSQVCEEIAPNPLVRRKQLR